MAPMSSGLILAYASHGIGVPACWRPPFLKRATNVARSGNFRSALPFTGVMFGVRNHVCMSAPGIGIGSNSSPPEKSGPDGWNVVSSSGVWQPTQFATYRARYSPRCTVGFSSGAVFGGLMFARGLNVDDRLL